MNLQSTKRNVKNQREAVEMYKNLVSNEGIHAILLCPGFTHSDVAEIILYPKNWTMK